LSSSKQRWKRQRSIKKDVLQFMLLRLNLQLHHQKMSLKIGLPNLKTTLVWPITALSKSKEEMRFQDLDKKGVIFRAKKTMAGSAAASGLGKAVLKKVIDEDNRRLIDAIKKMVTEFHGKEKAEFVEKSIIKLSVKTFLLVQNGNLIVADLLKIEDSLQKALKLLIKCFYSLDKVDDSVLLEKFYIIGALASSVEEILVELLKPHLKEKSIKRLSTTFSLLMDSQFLLATCNNKKLREDLTLVIKEAEWYVNVYDQASF